MQCSTENSERQGSSGLRSQTRHDKVQKPTVGSISGLFGESLELRPGRLWLVQKAGSVFTDDLETSFQIVTFLNRKCPLVTEHRWSEHRVAKAQRIRAKFGTEQAQPSGNS